jgi:hypothetical protein
MDTQYVSEDFGFTPYSLERVDVIEGMSIYTSPRLKENYTKAIAKQRILKPVIKDIEDLIRKDIIVPCFTKKNLLHLLRHKATSSPASQGLMGFYSPVKNKIYILFDNRVKFLSWADNDDLSKVTIHEMMHYVAKNHKKTFYNVFKPDFIKYYRAFYKRFAGVDIPTKQLELMIIGAIKMFEWEEDVNGRTIETYKKYLHKVVKLKKSEQNLVIDVPMENAYLYWTNPNGFMFRAKTNKETNRLVFSLWDAYEDAFNLVRPNTFPVQELIFPSEVCAISSEKPTSSHYRAVKFIR